MSPDPDYRGFQQEADMVRDDALDLVESAFRWVHDGLAGGDADAEVAAVILLSDVDQGVPLRGVLSTLLILADQAAAEMDAELSGMRQAPEPTERPGAGLPEPFASPARHELTGAGNG